MAKHCISCGKKGVRWPKREPEVCAAKCAADAFLAYAETGMFEAAYCEECGHGTSPGHPGLSHHAHCPQHPENETDEED